MPTTRHKPESQCLSLGVAQRNSYRSFVAALSAQRSARRERVQEAARTLLYQLTCRVLTTSHATGTIEQVGNSIACVARWGRATRRAR